MQEFNGVCSEHEENYVKAVHAVYCVHALHCVHAGQTLSHILVQNLTLTQH